MTGFNVEIPDNPEYIQYVTATVQVKSCAECGRKKAIQKELILNNIFLFLANKYLVVH